MGNPAGVPAASKRNPVPMTEAERLERTLAALDAANAEDPNLECVDGEMVPHEWIDARRVHDRVLRLDPNASVALRLASRCQHIRRWEIPRGDYPANRAGYLEWRRDLKKFHACTAAAVLEEQGWPAELRDEVRSLNLKQGLGRGGDVQTLEDALCLVFLESEYPAFLKRVPAGRMAAILRKTWRKMSPRGRKAALALPMEGEAGALLERAWVQKL